LQTDMLWIENIHSTW